MKSKWESKAKQVYQEGLKLFREGVQGLEVVAEKTFEAGKLKLANQQALNKIRGLFSDLGQRVFDIVANTKQIGPIKITPDMLGFVDQIKKMQGFIDSNLRKLKHLSTVENTRKPVARSVIKKAKKNTKKVIKKKVVKKKR